MSRLDQTLQVGDALCNLTQGSPSELHKRVSQNREEAVAKLEKGRRLKKAQNAQRLKKAQSLQRLQRLQRLKRALQQQRARAARLQLLANRGEVQLEIELEDAEGKWARQWDGADSDGGADNDDWEADAVEEHLALQQAAQAGNSTP